MDRRSPGRIIAGCFALCGFSTALLSSLGVSASAETVLLRAVVALVCCFIVGAVVGAVGERCISEGFENYQKRNPVPTPPAMGGPGSGAASREVRS